MQLQKTVNEVTISYKRTTINSQKIHTSKDAFEFLKTIWSDEIDYCEEFIVLFLNRANNITGYKKISKGSDCGTVVAIKMILQAAILSHACSIIISHNHPSGNLRPSETDISISKQIKQASNLMDISLYDSIIITSETYFSLMDNGLI